MELARATRTICWLLVLWCASFACGQDSAGPESAGHPDAGLPGSRQAAAQTSETVAPEAGKPVRVARLTFVAGEVKVQQADNTGEEGAVLNMPLHEGTRLLCGAQDGRLEIEFEDGSLVRLTPGSGLQLDSLSATGDVAHTHMTLLSGLAYFELRSAQVSDYVVEANGLRLSPVENTAFRVLLAPDMPASVAVLNGTARVESPEHFHVEVRMGESLRVDPADPARYFLDGTHTEESWDWWNEERDQAASDEAAHATAARLALAGSQGYGWADLDANGTWYDVPGLGMVWQPYAADESFDPYGFGDWVYDSGQYSFVSGYSWGWTPFRCGRWNYNTGFGWGWIGGPECGRWGFGGRHGPTLGSVPPHYHRPEPPPLGGHMHRTVLVRAPDGPRPPVLLRGRSALFNGHQIDALPTIGVAYTSQGGSAVGRGLLRDYPLDHTRQAVLGVEAGSLRGALAAPGWHEGRARGVTGAGVSASGMVVRSPGQGQERNGARSTAEAPARAGRAADHAGTPAQSPAEHGEPADGSGKLGSSEDLNGLGDATGSAGLRSGRQGAAAGSASDPSRRGPVVQPVNPRVPVPTQPAYEPRRVDPAPVRVAPPPVAAPARVAPAPAPSAPARVEPPKPK